MKKIILLLLAVSLSFSSCEKDDICDVNTPTTPQLVIEFFDAATPTLSKSVTKLLIVEEGNSTALGVFNASKIKIPLKVTDDVTKYRFILNYTDPSTALTNEDKLQFDYSRNNVFVSRACGFKTLFTLDASSPIKTDATTPDGFWIQSLVVSTKNILNENETHIKIYF